MGQWEQKEQGEAAEVEIVRSLRQALLAPGEEGYTSGQRLSEGLNISRTAIWKHIESLRKMGFEIEASPSKGYRLHASSHPFNAVEISSLLATDSIGSRVLFYDTLESTNRKAFELGRDGCEEGTVVVADSQSRGRGRIGRSWVSPPGVNLYTSIIFRPAIRPQDAHHLTFLMAVATAEAVARVSPVAPVVKWPNDVLIGGRKVAGVLLEMASEADRVHFIVAGAGVNVNMTAASMPDEIGSIATSLKDVIGADVDRAEFARVLYSAVEKWYKVYMAEGFPAVLKAWRGYFASEGAPVKVTSFDDVISGICMGVDDFGALLVRVPSGQVERVISGDVEAAG